MLGTVLVSLNNLQEAAVAMAAVEAYREGRWSGPEENAGTATPPIVRHLHAALAKAPMNPVKHAVLKILLAAPEGTWVRFPDLASAVVKAGAAAEADGLNRTQAALRDLSWQVREAVPAEFRTGLQKPIEALADRIRSGKDIQYRLTTAGRSAVEEFLGQCLN
jgi:hypothetical protein